MLTRKDAIAAGFFQNYIKKGKDEPVLKALRKNTAKFKKFLSYIPKKKIDYAYAPGKWTIRELLQHIIDAERVFGYRALRFARKDATPLPGFEENEWALHSEASARKWDDLINEFKALRKSTELLFASFSEEQLLATGSASNNPLNALALGYICSGHVAHHIDVIKDRYL
jgi:hypothetical protein